MLTQVADLAGYTFSLYSLPALVTTIAILVLGLLVTKRERISNVSLSFLFLTVPVSIWLFSFSMMYSSPSEAVALWWSKAAYLGVPFIAPATYHFTVVVLKIYRAKKWWVVAAWALAALFSIVAVTTNVLISGVASFQWGFYPQFTPLGGIFILYFATVLTASMVNYSRRLRAAPPGRHKTRIQWLMIAFGVGYIGAIDFVPTYGIPLYPFGYLAILGFLVVVTRTIWKYHLVDITPAFAARQIINTMTDAVIVLDHESTIRVVNGAASVLLGRSREELVGTAVASVLDAPIFSAGFGALMERGALASHEIPYKQPGGESRVLSVSASTMRGTDGRPVAVVSVLRDVTEAKRAQEKLELRLQRLAALRRIDTAITASFELRAMLDTILEQVTTQLHVDAAEVLLLDAGSQTLRHGAERGFRSPVSHTWQLNLSEAYSGRAVLECKMLHVEDISGVGGVPNRAFAAEEGFVAYYAVPLAAKGQVNGVLQVFHRSALQPDEEWLDFLHTLAGQTAIAVDSANLFADLQASNEELALAYDTTLAGWSRALDLRDKETEGHTQRVTEMTVKLARSMGIPEEELVHIRRGALLHDIGKMGIRDSILLKDGPLTDEEWEVMQRHPTLAYEWLSPVAFLRPALDIPYYHHEKWDGTGYPHQLRGEEIPLAARIFAVVDVWDALTSNRPYRAGWSAEKVRKYIREESGKHFDPRVVEAFLGLEIDGGQNAEVLAAVGSVPGLHPRP